MKRTSFIIFCLLSTSKLFGQQLPMGTVAGSSLDMRTTAYGYINQLKARPAETLGDVYLNEDWLLADIELNNGNTVLKNIPVKINLQTSELEIKHQNQVKVLPSGKVKVFRLLMTNGTVEKFVNARAYKLDNTPLNGFLQSIDSGKWELLVRPEVKLVKSNYNQALDIGERNDKYVKGETLYLAKDNQLYETRLSRQKFVKNFSGSEDVVSAFIKEHNINIKKVEDLRVLVGFLNKR